MSAGNEDVIVKFKDALSEADFTGSDRIASLSITLDSIAKELALSQDLREHLGLPQSSIWPSLQKLWGDLTRAQCQATFWDEDEDEESQKGEEGRQEGLRKICISLARFTRNLVAGVSENQIRAYDYEPEIRQLLHYHSSWTTLKEGKSLQVARVLAQTLSNIVTGNEKLMSSLWETYLQLPEDQVVLIRLLQSSEPHIIMPTLVLILNVIHGHSERIKLLCKTKIGLRIFVCLLDDMVLLFDAADGSDGAQAFDTGYSIFTLVVEENLVPELYTKLAMQDEIITPQQTVLLKLLDSYLQALSLSAPLPTPRSSRIYRKLSPILARCFFALSNYAQESINRALEGKVSPPSSGSDTPTPPRTGSDSTNVNGSASSSVNGSGHPIPPLNELDVMLPKVCEGLVLVAQSMVTITLQAEAQYSESGNNSDDNSSRRSPKLDPKSYFNEARLNKKGLVENLIDLLRLLDLFLPRINFGKPVVGPGLGSPGENDRLSTSAKDLSKTESSGLIATAGDPPEPLEEGNKLIGFSYVKRDLVRLLGILCHAETAVQDRIRTAGGISVVMNLCVVDERNPFLREHAIFTLRNLLEGNAENQTFVSELRPSAEWDEEGVLREISNSVARK